MPWCSRREARRGDLRAARGVDPPRLVRPRSMEAGRGLQLRPRLPHPRERRLARADAGRRALRREAAALLLDRGALLARLWLAHARARRGAPCLRFLRRSYALVHLSDCRAQARGTAAPRRVSRIPAACAPAHHRQRAGRRHCDRPLRALAPLWTSPGHGRRNRFLVKGPPGSRRARAHRDRIARTARVARELAHLALGTPRLRTLGADLAVVAPPAFTRIVRGMVLGEQLRPLHRRGRPRWRARSRALRKSAPLV